MNSTGNSIVIESIAGAICLVLYLVDNEDIHGHIFRSLILPEYRSMCAILCLMSDGLLGTGPVSIRTRGPAPITAALPFGRALVHVRIDASATVLQCITPPAVLALVVALLAAAVDAVVAGALAELAVDNLERGGYGNRRNEEKGDEGGGGFELHG